MDIGVDTAGSVEGESLPALRVWAYREHKASGLSAPQPGSPLTFSSRLCPSLGHPSSGVHWPRLGRHAGVEHGSLLPRESEVIRPQAPRIWI